MGTELAKNGVAFFVTMSRATTASQGQQQNKTKQRARTGGD